MWFREARDVKRRQRLVRMQALDFEEIGYAKAHATFNRLFRGFVKMKGKRGKLNESVGKAKVSEGNEVDEYETGII